MGILERIADIEKEIARTQKNKATEYHLGILKAKLAKYRQELLEIKTEGTSSKGDGFDVLKSGDARVALVGFPSVGKSTLLNCLTETKSVIAAYEFTTLTCIPGNISYRGANIQLLDLPGIIEGAAQGRGRGRQVISTARTADLVLVILDATKSLEQRIIIENELEAMGIRLNKRPPNITFRSRQRGGLCYTSTVKQSIMNEGLAMNILKEYKCHNAEIVLREDVTIDEFIDVVDGNRRYIPGLFVYNKIDQLTIEEVDQLAREPYTVVVSCELELNLDYLVDRIWRSLGLLRIYTKKRGIRPDFSEPLIVRSGATVEHVCHVLHRNLTNVFKYAMVWGCSAKHQPQKVGLQHLIDDEDVIQIIKKS